MRAGVVGEAVEIEALGAHRPERFVEDEAQEGRAQPLSGAGDGDALEVEVGVDVAEAAQDGEGLDRASRADPEPVGVRGRIEHRPMLGLLGAADAKLELRRALDRHHRADVGGRGRA